MKCCWQIFVLCISLMLILWLMAPCLDLEPESLCFPSTGGPYLDLNPQSPPSCYFQGMNSASELGRVWEKLFKVIPRTSVSHFDLFCGTCASVGNSKILWAASLGKSSYHTAVSRMNQVPIQGFEMLGNQTTGQSVSLRNGRDQGSWRQLDLLLLKLFVLAWTSDAMSEEILEDGPVP
ncbi:uncharacterized protein C20orf173 homolog [Neophocaena asiaeorientalis asiaeorientalis]|uniref:beta-D-galactosyl-(1->3)-N-acetyl-beta-D-galactosaminide alpha-2,3-sialyltransferase n=1 Tax=Neophocaena asiaeorientalis asiaeorientalis TaxID=1706337 RepID=A0A341BAZ2_NEOAA|nr:uncharacterized protein C20orf173 homolog [Neophocaena asiaeorientalis asiaeorientalis]